jgi:hypothetical protein
VLLTVFTRSLKIGGACVAGEEVGLVRAGSFKTYESSFLKALLLNDLKSLWSIGFHLLIRILKSAGW